MWHRHRTAPASAWLTASMSLVMGVVMALALDVAIVRPARDEGSFSRGIMRINLANQARVRAAYRVTLHPIDPEQDVALHRWRLVRRGEHGIERVLARGEDNACIAEDATARRVSRVSLRESDWGAMSERAVPGRLRAVLPEARGSEVRYQRWTVPDNARAEIVGCGGLDDDNQPAIVACADGVPSRMFLLPSRATVRARALHALVFVSAAAAIFTALCVLVGSLALRRWERGRA
ncbi:MAG: hypothetical protein Q8Q09_28135 [Deltaproteobacteria bacterium]|nr:hypothetical protein [Deltaproteobacteria bacterium]